MKKLILVITLMIIGASGYAYSCYKTKQCCKREWNGNLICLTKCDYQLCPFGYDIVIK